MNGNQLMTAQQKTIVGLGEGVNKAGVARGWWSNEVEGIKDGAVSKRLEAVYSMAVEGDGLWALTGTQVSQSRLSQMPCLHPVRANQSIHASSFTRSSRTFAQGTFQRGVLHVAPAWRERIPEWIMGWYSQRMGFEHWSNRPTVSYAWCPNILTLIQTIPPSVADALAATEIG